VLTIVISTIGAPFLLDSLATLRSQPDELFVVVDMEGRRRSPLGAVEPFEQQVLAAFPRVRMMRNESKPWAVMNGCYNLGWQMARNPFVLFTHDDMEYADYDYVNWLTPLLRKLYAAGERIEGRRVVGFVLPEYEVVNNVLVPTYPIGATLFSQCVSPVSTIVSTRAMAELGGFDTDGVWYDGHLEAELHLRNWWLLHVPTPPMQHTSNRTYRMNNWGNNWAESPWGNYAQNFLRKYPNGPATLARRLSPELAHPVTDVEFILGRS
jgi:hypothetical protein